MQVLQLPQVRARSVEPRQRTCAPRDPERTVEPVTTPETADLLEVLVVTGLSGAGRSTAARHLEDLGFFVVDNLPLGLLGPMVELALQGTEFHRLAVVADLRSPTFPERLSAAIEEVRAKGVRCQTLFLEASDAELALRFETARRPHPLSEEGRVVEAIAAEREILREIRQHSDLVLDTTNLNTYQLRDRLVATYSSTKPPLHLSVVSFGFKNGPLTDACLLLDCRFIPNPHWVPELRPGTGKDAPVRDYVMSQAGVAELLDAYTRTLRIVAEGYAEQGRQNLVVGVGCTGGRHRSVAVTEELVKRLTDLGLDASSTHRDLPKK